MGRGRRSQRAGAARTCELSMPLCFGSSMFQWVVLAAHMPGSFGSQYGERSPWRCTAPAHTTFGVAAAPHASDDRTAAASCAAWRFIC